MRILLAFVVFWISACSVTQQNNAAPQIYHDKYNARYNELVSVVRETASQEEFVELRKIYVYTSHYKPYLSPERSLSQLMFEALNNEEWDICLEKSSEILDFNYISLSAHYGAMACSFESDNKTQADYHKYVLNNLLDAIWSTGDGKSTETAFYCTSTPELQAFIQLHGLETIDQALIHHEGKAYDLMGVKDPKEDEEFKWYFDISSQWALGFKGLE
ncbi:MAG: DUF4919 domain-containing protein [Oceanicoccus sp.]